MSNIITDLAQIDERFLDVDFWTASRAANRELGCSVPRDLSIEPLGAERDIYGDVDEVIPMELWDDIFDRKDAEQSWLADLIQLIHDQDGEGSCVAETYTACSEIKMVEELGPDEFIPLSAAALYNRTGSSPGSGSTLSGNLREIRSRGTLPLNTAANKARFKHTHVAVGFRADLPDGWEETGKIFTQDEWVDLGNIEQFVTAIIKNQPVAYARSSHCITGVKVFGRVRTNNLKIGFLNSWGKWGGAVNVRFAYGMGYDSFSTVRHVASGATALRTTGLSPLLLKPLQPAIAT